MTKREICERMLILYADVNSLQTQIGVWNEPLDDAERDIRKAILDLAAPEEKNEQEPPPGVIAELGKDGEIEWCWCQKCYAQASVVHDPFGDGENWSYCKKCGVSFRLKRREEGEK